MTKGPFSVMKYGMRPPDPRDPRKSEELVAAVRKAQRQERVRLEKENADLKRQLAEARAALADILAGTDAARDKVLALIRREILVGDFAFWMKGWLEVGTGNVARARKVLSDD